ncbi:hypothetical protein OK015_23225 [Mycobacterium sp. Aquia_216]|uniref:hypothetical protein n=1 Tax=Mycobacterium sp. Aquia_216 TaxID=2991729 RepID=UPI00227A0BB6|nr:hypothetical protein [Mycobacterium sp. Aquia_216]WAJ47937.1 hypothetical protein OK015_23225 [Mycobacterium sp. Aquia_216]
MDLTFTEERDTIGKLARELFERRTTPELLTELEACAAAQLAGIGCTYTSGGHR